LSLGHANADAAYAVASYYQRAKAHGPAALDYLGYAIDSDQLGLDTVVWSVKFAFISLCHN
jgi:hypothetical protein